MSERLKGWQDPTEHSPQSSKPILLFVEDKAEGKRYQTIGIYFALEVPASDIDWYFEPENDTDVDTVKPGYYHLDTNDDCIYPLSFANTALLYWSYLPENPRLI